LKLFNILQNKLQKPNRPYDLLGFYKAIFSYNNRFRSIYLSSKKYANKVYSQR